MDASLNKIRQHIASAKKTSQITKAMQMVSTAKLTESENASKSLQKYSSKIRNVVTHLVAAQLSGLRETKQSSLSEKNYHMMLTQRSVKKTGYIVITSDKGLVGGYNSSILEQTMNVIQKGHDSNRGYALIAVNGTGADFFEVRGVNVSYKLRGLTDQPTFEEVCKIVTTTTTMYRNEVFDELYTCYNHHVNSLVSQFRAEKMSPITDLDPSEATSYKQEYLLEPSPGAILGQLLPQHTESLIYGAIIDARTAEHATGITVMKTATDNAQNIISDLAISYNHARQEAITQEITEIVADTATPE